MSLPLLFAFILRGVGIDIQLGRGGPRLGAVDATHIAARNAADAAFVNLQALPGVGADDVLTVAQLNTVGATAAFSANAMSAAAIAGAASQLSPGNALLTLDAGLPKFLMSRVGAVTSFAVRHIGDAANVAGQTVTYTLRKLSAAGVDTLVATSAALATTAGDKHAEQVFAAVAMAAGDALYVVATPSAALTATCTELSAGAG